MCKFSTSSIRHMSNPMTALPKQFYCLFLGVNEGCPGHANTLVSMAKNMARMTGSKNAALLLHERQQPPVLTPFFSRFADQTADVCLLIMKCRV